MSLAGVYLRQYDWLSLIKKPRNFGAFLVFGCKGRVESMVKKRRIGYSGLVMGVCVAAMFLVTDALDIGGYWPEKQA